MKSDLVKKLLRALVTALGIGLGSVLAFVIVQLNAMAGNPAMSVGALLALGTQIEVISPPEMVEEMRRRSRELNEMYCEKER